MTGSFGLLILPVIIVLSPIVLKIAAKQKKEAKQKLRLVFQTALILIVLLGLFNWETQTPGGRNAFQLAADTKNVFLWLFLFISFAQFILIQLKKSLLATVLNFANTIIFFAAAITVSEKLGMQIISPAIITTSLIVLLNNVLGLSLINKDPDLLSKYPWRTSNKHGSKN